MRMHPYAVTRLVDPKTRAKLEVYSDYLAAESETARTSAASQVTRYPLVNGIPVLIDESSSLFKIADLVNQSSTTIDLHEPAWVGRLRSLFPTLGENLRAKENLAALAKALPTQAHVLVIGGSRETFGMDKLCQRTDLNLLYSDVSLGPQTMAVVDAHAIPFADETFDAIVIQAVLEHVVHPEQCVAEMHRVLKTDGLIYCETPFIQQVHMRQYDFTRFTRLGHRLLFRNFSAIRTGAMCGPGMALAWSWTYFLRSFARGRKSGRILTALGHLTGFFWKYFDAFLLERPAASDAAAGFFFYGRKASQATSDAELLKEFVGLS